MAHRTSPKVRTYSGRVDPGERRNRTLLRTRDRIDRSYRDELDVPALAELAHLSRAEYIRQFTATFGETPYRYLQRRRIERAMHQLQWTDRSVTDICMEVGFSSLGTFSRTFRRIVGRSPREFRDAAGRPPGFVPASFAMKWSRIADP